MNNLHSKHIKKNLAKPNVTINLKLKMILLICALILGMFAIVGLFVHYFFTDSLEDQMGERVLNVARSVAHIPELREAFAEEDPASIIQPIVEPIREDTGAEFIVVGNTDEIRYAHPLPDRIGEKMVGDDNDRALIHGETYVSKAVGSLGPSMRGKVPVFSDDGEIIGVVSVGFLVDDIQGIIGNYTEGLWYILLATVTVGILGAVMIAHYIKKTLFDLEPEEISHLFLQKESILQSTHEGIIAVNQKGLITLMNQTAQRLFLSNKKQTESYIGKHIRDVLPDTRMPEVLDSGESQYDQEMLIGNHSVYVNRIPIFYEDKIIGAVSSFRDKTEIERLTKELRRIKQYTDALRAQTHEFSNKLYTISGLLQLDQKEEAIALIQKESCTQQEWIQFLIQKVPDPMISAVLLGKLNQANELGIDMTFHPESKLTYRLSKKKKDALLTVLGNLLENALEAVKKEPEPKRKVSIFFTDLGNDLVFEIEDSGPGIPPALWDQIFNQGFSTKEGSHRGIGLALSKQMISEIGGTVLLEDGELGGACFVVTIPKQENTEHVPGGIK
ncbi:two-component system CitB family sensor kinase/CitB family two-component system sensor histidine kinase CitS [Geomicrobium halophilum]|uniref:histidine kinase n=1 Tax=Geomicrobium halophilum TaxID=549000 RepID=A0A841PHJ9_9BACL|nr:sensor histidine kinase [Geomicrobium halophilum]MBB6448219.1 two-component system CitB family sensor kinase/CitB family two-component system sensor histidine kinase CitS [Geomicrobium halophilum]